MSFAAYLASRSVSADGRHAARHELRLKATSGVRDGETRSVTIHNLSATGLLLEADTNLPIGDRISVELPEMGAVTAEVVWQSDGLIGCKFAAQLPNHVISAARLQSEAPGLPDNLAGDLGDVGHRMQQARERLGLSRAELAAKVGLSVTTLWAWERGKTQPRGRNLRLVAEILNLATADLPGLGSPGLPHEVAPRWPVAEIEQLKRTIASALQIEPTQIEITIRL